MLFNTKMYSIHCAINYRERDVERERERENKHQSL